MLLSDAHSFAATLIMPKAVSPELSELKISFDFLPTETGGKNVWLSEPERLAQWIGANQPECAEHC